MATMYEVRKLGISIEANPLLTRLLWAPEVFAGFKVVIVKIALITFITWAAHGGFRGRACRWAIKWAALLYPLAACVHVYVLTNMVVS